MIVVLTEHGPVLEQPDDCRRFHIERRGGAVLEPAGRLAADGASGRVEVEWVRQAAEGRVGPDWPGEFEAMLAYAAAKGWLVGEAIEAHVEQQTAGRRPE
jgi:hypothetical protein